MLQLSPGTYNLVLMGLHGRLYPFSMAGAPVSFTVAAGEVAYLGALQVQSADLNPLDLFSRLRTSVAFNVADELEQIRPALARDLALVPNGAALQTRLATVRFSPVEVAIARRG